MEGIARAGRDRAGKRAAENHLAGHQGDVIGRQLVGQPRHAFGRVVEHRRRHPGLLDHAIAIQHRRHLAQVDLGGAHGAAAEHHTGIGGVVGDGVEHLAGRVGVGVDLLDAGVDDFQRRDHPFSGVEHIEHRAVGALERLAEDEGQFHFHPWHDEAFEGDVAAFVEKHVVEQGAVIGFGDIRRHLHGP